MSRIETEPKNTRVRFFTMGLQREVLLPESVALAANQRTFISTYNRRNDHHPFDAQEVDCYIYSEVFSPYSWAD